MSGDPRVSRRVLVAGFGVAGLAASGCAASVPDAAPHTRGSMITTSTAAAATAPATVDDIELVEAAIADERALLIYCTRAASRFSEPADLIRSIANLQRQHVAALRAALTKAGPDRLGHVPGPADSTAAELAVLRSLLDRAQHSRRADALAAESGPLARLLASISASHAMAATLDSLGG